jgi:sugar lactone lactonase YvrE
MKRFLNPRALSIVLLSFSVSICFGQNTLQSYAVAARDAYKAKDYKKFYENILEAHKLHPYHQGILFQAGQAAALNNQPKEAISYLNRAIQIKADFDLQSDDFSSLRSLPEFDQLKKLQVDLQKPIIHSDTAFVVPYKNLHIESIATGEKKGIFYLGSIHKRKILRTDLIGNTSDFTTSGQDGLASVFGVRVDAKKNVLWACASPFPEMENFDSTAKSGVFKYDLTTKKLLSKFIQSDKREYAFGDLTLDEAGKPYISDSKNATIFTVDEKSGQLVEFFKSEEFWSIQGVTFSDDEKYLFIADYVKGIFRLNLADKTLLLLPAKFDASLKAIDGLTFHKNSLIAIQNMVFPMRSAIYRLNVNMDELVSYDIIDRGHPAFNEPTIGCVSDNSFYYVANSLWSGYTKERKLKPENELQEVVILKADLK